MAGLFFWHKSYKSDSDTVNSSFGSLGYKNGKYLHMGDWETMVFPKASYELQNWREYEDGAICCVGTFGYKSHFYDKALKYIYEDIKSNSLDLKSFWGSFIIIAYAEESIKIIRDGAKLTPLYATANRKVVTTSLAGFISQNNSRLSIDKDAITELLMTGVLSGRRSVIAELTRILGPENVENCHIIESYTKDYSKPLNKFEAIEQQIYITREYISSVTNDWLKYMPKSVFDIGITGGMDSRLIATLLMKCQSKIVLHTHYRKDKNNKDFVFANLFSDKTDIPLHIKKVADPKEMSSKELMHNFEETYQLSDGVIRPGCYWDESYCTTEYRSGLTKTPYLRLIGFGGEQYRNLERLPLESSRSMRSWIKWEMSYQFAGRYYSSQKDAKRIENQIESNLKEQLGAVSFNLFSFKEYIRLVQSTSYRSLQANIENRLGFCLNPFLDTNLSIPSKLAIPFLGKSLGFQIEMMNRISPEISSIPNGYGFNFTKGEPNRLKIASIVWQYIPEWIKYPIYSKLHNHFRTSYIDQLTDKHSFIKELLNIVYQLDLPIEFEKHLLVSSRSRLVLNLGYFLKRNQEKLKW